MARTLGHVHGFVQGWLVVPGVIEPRLLSELNDALDANQDLFREDPAYAPAALAGERRRRTGHGMLQWPHPHCDPFRELIALPPLIGYLDGLLGRGWHLDQGSARRSSQPTLRAPEDSPIMKISWLRMGEITLRGIHCLARSSDGWYSNPPCMP